MKEHDAAEALFEVGLRTEAIGPTREWSPVPPAAYQRRHDTFWRTLMGVFPEHADDEPEWMTETASAQLLANN